MASVLYWLTRNYDPRFEIPMELTTETSRVNFVKTVATFIAPKQVRLNTRSLYRADGFAVKELMKISGLLSKAKQSHLKDIIATPPLDLSNKIGKLKDCRTLASLITEKGAQLYDFLGKEMELRVFHINYQELRTNVISKPFELMGMEKAVDESIKKLEEKLETTKSALESMQADESNLFSKIEKKKQELERAEKRLKSLQSVRPAYMDEYEKIEGELVKVYEQYMEKFRNLAYLEQQLDEFNLEEQTKFEETESSLKQMQNRLREEELKLLRGETEGSHQSLRPSRPSGCFN